MRPLPTPFLILLLLTLFALPTRADEPNSTRTYVEGPVTFQLITRDGRLTLVASGTLNVEAPFTTEAERAKVPADVLNLFRLARIHAELGDLSKPEWDVLSVKIAAVIKFQNWLSAAFERDPWQLGSGPTDPANPLTAPAGLIHAQLAGDLTDGGAKTALLEYRDARAKIQGDLTRAQSDLYKVITVRQEVILVRLGVMNSP